MLLISGQRVKSLHPAKEPCESVCCQCIICSECLQFIFFFVTLRLYEAASERMDEPTRRFWEYERTFGSWPDACVVGRLPEVTPTACEMVDDVVKILYSVLQWRTTSKWPIFFGKSILWFTIKVFIELPLRYFVLKMLQKRSTCIHSV